ncbi:MAG: hypothetical protein ACOZDD_06050 [Bacteroidota bacterium]
MAHQTINFQLRGIEIAEISIKHPEKQLPVECKFNMDINLQQRIIGKENTIIVTPAITVKLDDDNFICSTVKVNFIFLVENLDEFRKRDSEEFEIPEFFNTTINSVSLSTIRGIMYSHYKGTFLHNTILPIVNPGDFKKEKS